MNSKFRLVILIGCLISLNSYAQKNTSIWLDDLKIQTFSEGIPSVSAKKNQSGDSIRIAGKYFERGIGVQSVSVLSFLLNGKAEQFSAMVGADDRANKSMHVQFYVLGDEKVLFESGTIKVGDAPQKVSVNLSGIQRMGLLVTVNLEDEGYGRSYSDWADAKLVMLGENVPQTIPNSGEKYILTPKSVQTPKINSAGIFGVTPGNPFLYTIAASGERPIQFSSENLPKGLVLNSKTGVISGKISKRGTYLATLKAKNAFGEARKLLKIVIGDTIALTPPIGWNGWNSWAKDIDGEKVIASAKAMVSMGLSNHGWTYINIDDAWQGQRGGKFNALQANEKFPKFKEMIDQIHAMGLKLGVYSTPWISSYAGYAGASSDFEKGEYPDSIKNNKRAYRRVGKYRFEMEDARQMAEWGVDYLKYDWRIDLNSAERMSEALKKSGRDILYSLSNSAPFENAKAWARVSNAWRTGPDIRDSWLSLYTSAFTIDKWAPFGGPGHWNDPDMLILGNVTTGTALHPTRLTPDEQYSHVSLFSLLAAPLLIGCPIEQLDAFTLNLLTNDEVIEVNQDPLGKSARLVTDEDGVQIWLKPLEDGSYAVGLFNIAGYGKTPQSYFHWGNEPAKQFVFDFSKVGLTGKWKLRDLWRQKNLGEFSGSYSAEIRHHGVLMLRMYPKNL
jgi:alpha-galactosidase